MGFPEEANTLVQEGLLHDQELKSARYIKMSAT
jgi:hypothetical protein